MSNSMTQGNPLKVMLQFAFPLLIGNLLQQTYNIIDAAPLSARASEPRHLPASVPAPVFSFWSLASAWEAVPALAFRSPNISAPAI